MGLGFIFMVFAFFKIPNFPLNNCCISFEPGTTKNITAHLALISSGLLGTVRPPSFFIAFGFRSHPSTLCPALAKLVAMPAPIFPSPITPTVF